MRVHDSQACRKMDVTRERISRILELREILLSFQTDFNLVKAAVVCDILESISGLIIYQRGSQDPTGNQTTRRPPDYRKEMQTAVVWTCLPFIRSGQNQLGGHSERGRRQGRLKKRWETTSGNGQAWSLPSPRGQWRANLEKNCCEAICVAPTTLVVKG